MIGELVAPADTLPVVDPLPSWVATLVIESAFFQLMVCPTRMATGFGTNDWAPRLPAIDTVTLAVVVGDVGVEELPQAAVEIMTPANDARASNAMIERRMYIKASQVMDRTWDTSARQAPGRLPRQVFRGKWPAKKNGGLRAT